MSEAHSAQHICRHCRGTQYVLTYWLEKAFEREGIHMTDIPPDIFKLIPVDYLIYCHCNVRLALFGNRNSSSHCHECNGTTWRFTEVAEQEGYRWRKVSSLTSSELKALPCEYFERCPCGHEDAGPKDSKRKQVLKDIFELLDSNVPSLGFSF